MLTVSMKIRLLLVTTVSRRNDKERQLYLACEQLFKYKTVTPTECFLYYSDYAYTL